MRQPHCLSCQPSHEQRCSVQAEWLWSVAAAPLFCGHACCLSLGHAHVAKPLSCTHACPLPLQATPTLLGWPMPPASSAAWMPCLFGWRQRGWRRAAATLPRRARCWSRQVGCGHCWRQLWTEVILGWWRLPRPLLCLLRLFSQPPHDPLTAPSFLTPIQSGTAEEP